MIGPSADGPRSDGGGADGGAASRDAIPWRRWGGAAFEEAAAGDLPLFLTLQTRWCAWCRRLEAETLADPRVARLLANEVIPVRVDAERLPHVRDRYIGQGWPTVAFLTPSGGVLWSGPFVTPDELLTAGNAVVEAWKDRGAELNAEVDRRRAAVLSARRRRTRSGMPRREAADDVLTYLRQAFDDRNGGFGDAPKYPAVDAVSLLHLQGVRLGSAEFVEMADRTLDGMLAGEMRSDAGGFHRYALEADWTRPSRERLLIVTAEIARTYAAAAAFRGREDWERVARDAFEWAVATLARGDGLMGTSVAAWSDGPDDGGGDDDDGVDRTAYADANAVWVRCLADAGVRLGEPQWIARASAAFARAREEFDPEGTAGRASLPVHHTLERGDPPEPLLVDAAEMLAAAVALARATGSVELLQYAGGIAARMRADLWSADEGFADRVATPDDPMAPPDRPFHENAAAVGPLLALDRLLSVGGARSQAERTLAFLSPVAAGYGIDAAAFALAADAFFDPPPLVVIRGAFGDPGSEGPALRAEATGRPETTWWLLTEDATLAGRVFSASGEPAAWVGKNGDWTGPFTRASDLAEALDP